jgi:hypothetical protein
LNTAPHTAATVDDRYEAFFDATFTAQPSPEFPGNGRWGVPVFAYDRSGAVASQPNERWGAPFVIAIQPLGQPRWVGIFSTGGLGGVRSAFACPRASDLCVVVDGLAYLLDVGKPALGALVVADQVRQVVAEVKPPRLFLATWTGIAALGPEGLAWRESRIALDGLQILATSPYLLCRVDDLKGGTDQVRLDPATGRSL